jgi:dUTP pyrophosphatase
MAKPLVLKYVLLSEKASKPVRSSELAAGLDISSAQNVTIPAKGGRAINTDLTIELPANHYGRLEARSGMAKDFQISLACGTIDNDYRGMIQVILFNHSDIDFEVLQGDRIAQLICAPYSAPTLVQVKELSPTKRGAGGFGSTSK